MSSPARVVIGLPMYGDGEHLREALESLMAQQYDDVRFILLDDGLAADAAGFAQRVPDVDSRFSYLRTGRRLGLAGAWREAFAVATRVAPEAEYFAWASDHDVWHPRWVECLAAALDSDPGAVLACPFNWVTNEGGQVTRYHWRFDTAGIDDAAERFRRTNRRMSAGNMIYGLYRARDLHAVGVFPLVLLPDRLLLLRLSLRGRFLQHPEVLWYRRTSSKATVRRQRHSLFPAERPWHVHLPWWVVHAASILWTTALAPDRQRAVSRAVGVALTWDTLYEGGMRNVRKRRGQLQVWTLKRTHPVRKAIKRFVVHRITMPLGAWRRRLLRSTLRQG